MARNNGRKMFEMSNGTLKLDCASRMMHLNFWRRWDISLIISGHDTACYRSDTEYWSCKEDGWIWRTKCPFNTEYRLWVRSLKSSLKLPIFTIECCLYMKYHPLPQPTSFENYHFNPNPLYIQPWACFRPKNYSYLMVILLFLAFLFSILISGVLFFAILSKVNIMNNSSQHI